jgi:hypothetical protein
MTRTPRGISARQLVRALESDGFVLQRVLEVIGSTVAPTAAALLWPTTP